MNVTAIIIVKNNPPHLSETLDSIEDFVSEIIIGEISMDPTLKRTLEHNSKYKFISLPETVPYADLVKEDLKSHATGDFILYLDPDEIFPSSVKNLLRDHVESSDYFYFPRKNLIFGKWIKHSRWWPDYQLRFFRKDAVVWPKTIHPVPVAKGKEYKFESKAEYAIVHHNYENIDEFMNKMPRYAKGEAIERLERKEELTLIKASQLGISEFVSRFFASQGYKDGMHGLVLAFLQMFYYFLVYFYFWELKEYPEVSLAEMASVTDAYFKQGLYETKFWKNKTGIGNGIEEKIKMKIIKRL